MPNCLSFNIFKINNPYLWIVLGIAVRLLVLLQQPELPDATVTGLWGHYSCDTPSYLNPVEHLLKHGTYNDDFRMPGYAWIYYCLRLLFSFADSVNILVLLQLFFSGTAIYFLAHTAFLITDSKKVFIFVYILSLITTYNAVYDSYLLTESFCTSSGIMAFYFLVMGIKKNASFPFLCSGLFFTWMIFLKPVYFGFFLIIVFFLIGISFNRKKNHSVLITRKHILLFLLPFILSDGIWTIRNYAVNHKIHFLTNPFFAPKEDKDYPRALTVFLQSWGGIHSVWKPHGHNLWFEGDTAEQKVIDFPDFLTQGKVKMDSLLMVRHYIQNTRNISLPEYVRIKNDILAATMLKRLTQYAKDEFSANYYIYAPIRYAIMFYADSGTYLLFYKPFSTLSIFQKIIVLFLAAVHYIIIFSGTAISIYFIIRIRKTPLIFFFPASVVLYTFIIFPFVLRMPETRFMVPVFPFQIICLALFVSSIFSPFKKRSLSATASVLLKKH